MEEPRPSIRDQLDHAHTASLFLCLLCKSTATNSCRTWLHILHTLVHTNPRRIHAAVLLPLLVAALLQVPELDVVVVPVSGGGMLSGITLAAKALKPGIVVIAAEPCGSNDAADVAASKRAGQLVTHLPKPVTIADGLQGEAAEEGSNTGMLPAAARCARRSVFCVWLLQPEHFACCTRVAVNCLCKPLN